MLLFRHASFFVKHFLCVFFIFFIFLPFFDGVMDLLFFSLFVGILGVNV